MRIPALNEVGIRQMINGPIPITADGEPIIGLSPELDNFYLCCGFTSGIAGSGGAGMVMANWIVDGDPGMDLWPFDVRRFGAPHSVKQFMYDRAVESYGRYYHIAWPAYEADVGRDARRSPLHARLEAAGAVYGNKFGWERPNWFAPLGTPAVDTLSFERGPSFAAIGEEHKAVRERVALMDMTSFSKYEIRGPGALALLQKLAVNNLDRPVGTIVYTQLCNERGGIEADVTITRLADDRFYFVTGSALGRARPLDHRAASARGRQRRDRRAHVGARGAEPVRAEVARRAGDADRRAARQRELPVHERAATGPGVCAGAGAARDLPGRAGLRAARARRIRAVPVREAVGGRRAATASPTPATAPSTACGWKSTTWCGARTSRRITITYEAGLGFCVAANKGEFLARAALADIKARGPKQKLTWFTAPAEVNMFGGEIVLAGDRVLGRVTSAGYGYTVGRNILCAYIAADEPVHAEYSVEVMGERYPAVRHTKPLYDPDRIKILAVERHGQTALTVPSSPPSSPRAATATACRARSTTPTRCTRRKWRASGTAGGCSRASRSKSRSRATTSR